jgi:hypothetical protein
MNFDPSNNPKYSTNRSGKFRAVPDNMGLLSPGKLIDSFKVGQKYFINPQYETEEGSDYNFTAGDPIQKHNLMSRTYRSKLMQVGYPAIQKQSTASHFN